MRYVPSLPPVVEPPPEGGEVKAIAHVAAVHRVAERTLPPMIYRHRAEPPVMPAINRRWEPRPQAAVNDRRRQCRRIRSTRLLIELRSSMERRRRNQRKDDLTTAIDEEI